MRSQRIALIREIAQEADAFDKLEQHIKDLPREDISGGLLDCGIIPESFAHDSSEEKLWAKYCDILLSQSLTYLGIKAQVIRARGHSADVFGQTDEYTLVGDAKAFRLSRTAKNQKDFKVAALDDWRRSNTFACLIAPLNQFPNIRSQIYTQAEQRKVTLLSYVHLKFLLDHPPKTSLFALWSAPSSLAPSPEAKRYWQVVDQTLLELTQQNDHTWQYYKQQENSHTIKIGQEGVEYWKEVMATYQTLSQKEAVARLIKAEKIEQKIAVIESVISNLSSAHE